MKDNRRLVLIFAGACVACVYFHEIGHAIAGWVQGIPVVPTPAKEYILAGQVEWHQKVWISLGGVIATALLAAGALFWFVHDRRPNAGAVLGGILLSPFVYTVRFLLVGRGHDGLEWQEAQSALGLAPAGHAVDILFLCLTVAGAAVWMVRRYSSLRIPSIVRLAGLAVAGIIFLVALQVANNAIFDPLFTGATTMHVPEGLDPR